MTIQEATEHLKKLLAVRSDLSDRQEQNTASIHEAVLPVPEVRVELYDFMPGRHPRAASYAVGLEVRAEGRDMGAAWDAVLDALRAFSEGR